MTARIFNVLIGTWLFLSAFALAAPIRARIRSRWCAAR